MFIFFLQKNHVLQDDTEFLLTKFNDVKKKKKDYYQDFLLPLFFNGFAKKDSDADKKEFVAEYGHVKYLNGGLFYPNKIELKYATLIEEKQEGIKITIPDATNPQITISSSVLNEVITFLNGYTWYLDNRPTKDEREITGRSHRAHGRQDGWRPEGVASESSDGSHSRRRRSQALSRRPRPRQGPR